MTVYTVLVNIFAGWRKTTLMGIFWCLIVPGTAYAQQTTPSLASLDIKHVIVLLSLGIFLSLVIYQSFIYTRSRQRRDLYFALSTLMFALGWAILFGIVQQGAGTQWQYPSFLLGAAFSTLFLIEFLQLNNNTPRTAQALKVVAVVSAVCLVPALWSQELGIYLSKLACAVVLFVGLYVGFHAWKLGDRSARYLVFALLAILLPNGIGSLVNLITLPGMEHNIFLAGLLGHALGALLLAFALAEKLRLSNEKHQTATENLEQQLELSKIEVDQANLTIEHLLEELQDAYHSKTRFLANMSYEIRTPLTSIIGYAESILAGDIDRKEQERVIKIIAENGDHLLSVLNDILDISRIEANKMDFEFVPTPLFSILAQIESGVGKRARDKGLAFHLDYRYPLPATIITDPTRLRQILFNLTNNAIKYTDQGYIGLAVNCSDDELVITVKDSGHGISKQQQHDLFEPFTQTDSSITRYFGGSGLGLSISRRIAQGLKGDLTVNSELGSGSEFTLRIGLEVSPESEWIHSISEVWKATPEHSLKTTSVPSFSGSKVLLADDHITNRELVALLLRRMNIAVTEVDNGKQVIDRLLNQRFDLVLLDIQMAEMDGIATIKQMRSMGNHTPTIALTANTMKKDIARYIDMGFNDHLAKPITRHEFIDKLSHYLSHTGEADSLIDREDLQTLINDYLQDLRQQIPLVKEAWQIRNMTSLAELSHRIKGSAASFGFGFLADQFAELEKLAKQDDEAAISIMIEGLLGETERCVNLPGVDIATGIINHNNDAEQFLNALREALSYSTHLIELLEQALDNGEINNAVLQLNQLLPQLERVGIVATKQACHQLQQAVINADLTSVNYAAEIRTIQHHLSMLAKAVA